MMEPSLAGDSHAAKERATGHYGGRAFSHLTHRQLIGWIGLWLSSRHVSVDFDVWVANS